MIRENQAIKKLKLIAVSYENYDSLKDLGKAGESFNDVVTKLLKEKSRN